VAGLDQGFDRKMKSLLQFPGDIDPRWTFTVTGTTIRQRKWAPVRPLLQTLGICVESDIFCFTTEPDTRLVVFGILRQS
jgi:hypothetical protein